MILTFHEVSTRGRKAYKDDTGTLYLECTSCHAIKPENAFLKEWPVIMGNEKPAPEGNDQMRLMFIAIAQGVVRHLLDNEAAITVNTGSGPVAVQITTDGNLY